MVPFSVPGAAVSGKIINTNLGRQYDKNDKKTLGPMLVHFCRPCHVTDTDVTIGLGTSKTG